MRLAIAAIGVLCLSTVAFSATIYVPDNYSTIRDAIYASVNGDTIIVRPGTYVETINFSKKAITVKSEQGAGVTTIDGNNTGSVVTFKSGESASSVLEGFTVTNGSGNIYSSYTYGGGIYCDRSSPIIRNNIVRNNRVSHSGGGIYCEDFSSPIIIDNFILLNSASSGVGGGGICCVRSSSPTITNNTITGNLAPYKGGGIYCHDSSSPFITNNTISGNSLTATNSHGGAVHCFQDCSPIITNNTIVGNLAVSTGGGIYCRGDSTAIITNTILWDNNAASSQQISLSLSNPVVTYCDVEGGWTGTGNINTDPLFVDPANGDFHLTWNSPCSDSGNNTAVSELYDLEGDPRIVQGTVDMGSDELFPHLYHAGGIVPGSFVSIRIVGWPGAWAWLVRGSGVLDPPISTKYGDMYMQQPFVNSWVLGNIPNDGVLRVPTMIPATWLPGEQYPYQAMIGPAAPYPAMLTNHVVVTVE